MSLKQYIRKRNFAKTPEPSGKPAAVSRSKRSRPERELAFAIQKHDATRLHYDFRLELEGTLKSWAVPKGPSLDPKQRRLAVEVEDHPLEYGGFEGVIPYGQYGGGTVLLWDKGIWIPEDPDPAAALRAGKLRFQLKGDKLKGGWTLARMHGREKGGKENWLLMKREDEWATKEGPELTDRETRSVKSGKDLDDIASAGGQARKRSHEVASTKMPTAWKPQLCTLTDVVPSGEDWLHEIKFDGYRLLAQKTGSNIHLITRGAQDWTKKFPPITDAIESLACKDAVVDGEAVVLDQEGKSRFQELQKALKGRHFASLAFFVFDLLFLDGTDLRKTPLLERKQLLQKLLTKSGDSKIIRYSDHVQGDGTDVQQNACRLGLEGIVSKQSNAPYAPGRSRTWLKIKCGRRQEFVIVGSTAPAGARKHFGSLLLAARNSGNVLVYTGKVGTGFDVSTLKSIAAKLDHLKVARSPLGEPPPRRETAGAIWVRPELVAEIAFTEWTDDGRLRHPVFEGLREDKKADEVRIERAAPTLLFDKATVKRRPSRSRTADGHDSSTDTSDTAGVVITHPERVVFPDVGVTKLGLAKYYAKIGPLLLPHLADRPLSVLRCVKGLPHQCFFQKHLRETFAAPVRSIRVKEKAGAGQYIAVDSVAGIVTLIQMGVIEIHPWGSKADTLETPDQMTFDLDPGEGVSFERVKQGANEIRRRVESRGLHAFLKTSGGKGLHVVVPIVPDADWEIAKDFAGAICRELASEQPTKYTANMSKAQRTGKIFLDYLRNGRGATSIAPYAVRARAGAPVAMPLDWERLAKLKSADQFTLLNAPGEIHDNPNTWRDYLTSAESILGSASSKTTGRTSKKNRPTRKR